MACLCGVLMQGAALAAANDEAPFFSRFFRSTPELEPIASPPLDSETLAVHELGAAPGISKTIDLTAQPDDLWVRIRNGFAMTDLNDDLVLYYQQWYQNRPEALRRMVERSRPYMHHIVAEIEARGMPTELALLPMVESSFNPMAYSRSHASGLWQFIPATGKRFNLEQNWWQDQRRDIVASTGAALEYLQTIYDMHGDWHLALASYNWGEGAVKRAIEKNAARGLATDYSSLTMPNETRHYVPKLQALKNIFGNPVLMQRLGLPEIKNSPYFSVVETGRLVDVKTAARLANMPLQDFLALNPSHNRPVIQESSSMVIPMEKLQTFQNNLENTRSPLSAWQAYTVKAGEKLNKLAPRFGITMSDLLRVNGLSAKGKPQAGSTLLVPNGLGDADLGYLPMVAKLPKIADAEPVKVLPAKHTQAEKIVKGKGAKASKPLAHAKAEKGKTPAKSASTAKSKHDKPPGKAKAASKVTDKKTKHH
jgi:membrane-bound lytic murein transglycosylase D